MNLKARSGEPIQFERPLWLASGSPRRRQMLEEAGIEFRVMPPDVDDGRLSRGDVAPEQWVMSLAYLKARRVAELIRMNGPNAVRGTVLGADTVCVLGNDILGQPRDAFHARSMLERLRDAEHKTITGVCLLGLNTTRRKVFCDRTTVHIGHISDAEIETYIASDSWRGKAGAYNLSERLDAGWPIRIEGDPATVMGLPMRRLLTMLNREP